jgi:cyclic pyranopterin phosphate synthase
MPKRTSSAALTHVGPDGQLRMVDVGGKPVTAREAVATGAISMSPAARRAIRDRAVKKGDPLQAARLAGIMAAKRTSELIPLCHPLALTHVAIDLRPTRGGYAITARVRTSGQTGVEMEALTAVTLAALTIYDMLKAVDRWMTISDVKLVEKQGGKSGRLTRTPGPPAAATSAPGPCR